MGWSYAELMATPAPVVEELTRWLKDQYVEQQQAEREQARQNASLPTPRARGRRR